MKTTITINGQTDSSVEQMPPEVRRQYDAAMGMLADRDGNGIPDVLEGKGAPRQLDGGSPIPSSFVTKISATSIKVNGREYSRWEDVPQAARDAFERARAAPQISVTRETVGLRPRRVGNPIQPFAASDGIRIGLPWLIVLLLIAVLAGFLLALKLR